jgi:conjugal transfer pilin signal peptidase TrbI
VKVLARLREPVPVPLWLLTLCLAAAPVTAHVVAGYRLGIDLGLPPSLPYRLSLIELRNPAVGRGDLVAFRAVDIAVAVDGMTIHPDGTWLLKRVVGAPGDRVRIDDAGLYVEGVLVAEGLSLAAMLGRPAEHFHRDEVIEPGQLYVAGSHPQSYDSRYFGAIASHQVIGRAHGLW